jgi:hypothetical protein
MSKQIVMRNPHLNHLVMALEMPIWTLSQVWADDRKTGKAELHPTDSTVKSALRRVMGHLKGRPPKPLDFKKERDQWIDNLTENVWQVCRNHLLQATPKSELLICLVAIEDSIKIHTTRDPRGYLEFLDGFFAKLGATTRQIDEQTASQLMIAESR